MVVSVLLQGSARIMDLPVVSSSNVCTWSALEAQPEVLSGNMSSDLSRCVRCRLFPGLHDLRASIIRNDPSSLSKRGNVL